MCNFYSSCNAPVLGILVLSGIILLPVLLPVSATDNGGTSSSNTVSNGTFNELDKLSMANITVRSVLIIYFNEHFPLVLLIS